MKGGSGKWVEYADCEFVACTSGVKVLQIGNRLNNEAEEKNETMLVFSFDLLKYGNPGGRQKTFGRWLSSAVALVVTVNMFLAWCGRFVWLRSSSLVDFFFFRGSRWEARRASC